MANPEIDQLIEKANEARKPEEQRKLYAQILKRVHEEAPLIQLVDLAQAAAIRDNVRGIYLNGPANNFPAQFGWKEKR